MAIAAETELVRSLEEGGLSRRAAEELVAALGRGHRRERRPDLWMLAYAALLTALIVGGFGWMSSRIDTLDAKIGNLDTKTTSQIDTLNAKIGNLDSKMTSRIDTLDAKIGNLDSKMTSRIDTLDAKIGNLDSKTTSRIDTLDAKIGNLDAKTTSRIDNLDAKIGNLDAKIDETREEMIQRLTTIETIITERLRRCHAELQLLHRTSRGISTVNRRSNTSAKGGEARDEVSSPE